MIEFNYEHLRVDGDEPRTDWDILLRLVAEFSIVVPPAPIPLYREEEFCVVEFAMQVTQWLAVVRRDSCNFSYSSVESEETGLVSLKREGGLWRVAALNQDYVEDRLFSLDEIETGVGTFVARLTKEARRICGRDVSHLVSGRPIVL